MAATNGTMVGVYEGVSWAAAFTNPDSLDILQVVNEGGEVVWNLDSTGTPHIDPGSPSATALLARYFGATLAAAFDNPSSLDIIQIVNPNGQNVVHYIDYSGAAH